MTEILLSVLDSRGMAVKGIKAIVEKEINDTGTRVSLPSGRQQ
jgi:hypothetical protein